MISLISGLADVLLTTQFKGIMMAGVLDQMLIDVGVSLLVDVMEEKNSQIGQDPHFEEELQQNQNVQALYVYSANTNTDDPAMEEYDRAKSDPLPLSSADEEIVKGSHESCEERKLKCNNTIASEHNIHSTVTVQENTHYATKNRSVRHSYLFKWYDDHTYAMVIGGSSRNTLHHKQYQEFRERLKTGSNCCVICHMECEDLTNFKKHVTLHSTDKPLECVECWRMCRSIYALRHHTKKHSFRYKPPARPPSTKSPVTYPRECQLCSKVLKSPYFYKIHRLLHDDESPTGTTKNYSCGRCDKRFISSKGLNNHTSRKSCRAVGSVDQVQPNKFKCDRCDKTFSKNKSLKYHTLRQVCNRDAATVPELPKLYTCDVCGHSMATNGLLKRHMYRHTGQSPHICSTCDKAFPSPKELQDHVTVHNEARPFKCSSCGKCFRVKNAMRKHMKVHILENPETASQHKLYPCAHCEKPFTTQRSLKRHKLMVHTMADVRPFRCGICGRRFKQQYEMSRHVKLHTKDADTANKPAPYSCEFCGATFSKQAFMNYHRMSHTHGHALYNCDKCDACFNYSAGLTRHKKIHSDNKPFECDICGLRFRKRCNFMDHLVTHSTDYPFKCESCGKGFNRERTLRTHRKMHLDNVNNITT